MDIKIKKVSFSVYAKTQLNYNNTNFLQSAQMAEVQNELYPNSEMECLLFVNKENDEVVGQAIVQYRTKYRFFQEAIILQGPLLDYRNSDLIKSVLIKLKNYWQSKKIAQWTIQPYIINEVIADDLSVKESEEAGNFINLALAANYKRIANYENVCSGILQIFIKPLANYRTIEELDADYQPALKRNFKKFLSFGVKTKVLSANEIKVFYDILKNTGERKDFYIKNYEYFVLLQKYFADNVRFYYAYLDYASYLSYLEEQLALAKKEFAAIEKEGLSKKNQGNYKESSKNIKSYTARISKARQFNVPADGKIPLSAYLLLSYGNESICLMGGSVAEFLNFGGSTLLNKEMISYAYSEQKEIYNFYGTMETSLAENNQGNFKFKKQFGGYLARLPGFFTYKNHWLLKLITKLK